jgi:hypothetical protein
MDAMPFPKSKPHRRHHYRVIVFIPPAHDFDLFIAAHGRYFLNAGTKAKLQMKYPFGLRLFQHKISNYIEMHF